MPPNALINEAEAATILKYVLSLADTNAGKLNMTGSFTPKLPDTDAGRGSVVLRAVYTDQGAEQATPLTAQYIHVLRSPVLSAAQADVKQHAESGMRGVMTKLDSVVGFKNVDLTGVKQVEIVAMANAKDSQAGGTIQIRLDSATGDLLGEAKVEPRDPPTGGGRGGAGGGRGGFNPFAAGAIKVNVTDTKGKHGLYLVFKNDLAKDGASLMSLTSLRLSSERPMVAPGGQP